MYCTTHMSNKKKLYTILLFLLISAVILRLWNMDGFITFLGDQGRDASIIRNILLLKHFPAIGAPSSVGGVYLGPFYYYFIAPWLLIFNFNPVGLGYGVACMSIVGLIALYFQLKPHVSKISLLLFLTFCTFSAILIELSRFSWNPNLLPIFGFLTITFFVFWIEKRSRLYAVLFGSFFALSTQLHYLALILSVPVGIHLLFFIFKKKSSLPDLKQCVLAFGAFLFFSIPLIIFDLRHDFLNTHNFIALFTQGKITSSGSYISRLTDTVNQFMNFSLGIEMATITALILFVVLMSTCFFAWKKKPSLLISLHTSVIVLYILIFAFLESPRHFHYFGPVYMSFYLILANSVYLIKDIRIKYIVVGCTTLLFIFIQCQRYSFLYYPPNNQITFAKHVAEKIKPHVKKQPIQMVALPTTETDGHFRYFLELADITLLPQESPEQAEELYVVCFETGCKPVDDPHWQIAAFYDKKIDTSFPFSGGIIYKIIHKK